MPSIGVDDSDMLRIVTELSSRAAKLGPQTLTTVQKFGLLLQGRIQARASGRPGPRVRTGDYRRSWNTIVIPRLGEVSSDTGTSSPQARRLEFGFTGVDALGRHYDQPPFPHARPALTEIEPGFVAAIGELGEFT